MRSIFGNLTCVGLIFGRPASTPRRRAPSRCRPTLEQLERREVPALFTVTSLVDGDPGSLRDAILQSNATPGHNDIEFAVTGTHALSAQFGELRITNGDVTIKAPPGEPEILDAGRQGFRVLHINASGDVTTILIGLIITDGQVDGLNTGGGGIRVDQGNLTLIGVTVSNCSAPTGGGIFAEGRNMSLVGCTIQNNLIAGSFVVGGGGGAYFYGDTLTVTDCTFDGNSSSYGSAGGGLASSARNSNTIRASTFSNNVANTAGGGLSIDSGEIIDCRFVGNTGGSGGGLSAYMATVSGCTFSNNSAPAGRFGGGACLQLGRIVNGTFDHNSAAGSGGGLFANGIDIRGSTFSNNTALNGGGIFAGAFGVMSLTNCTLAGNVAARNGGGLYVNVLRVNLDYCTVAANQAGSGPSGGNGGGVFVTSDSRARAALHASIVALNTAADGVDVFGAALSYGYNLIGNGDGHVWSHSDLVGTTGKEIDPKLDPLCNYGGPTQTMRLRADSPAIAHGDPNDFPLTDQRGRARPAASVPCIGAFELYPDDL
jgi:predicted outer membrane repeat protein